MPRATHCSMKQREQAEHIRLCMHRHTYEASSALLFSIIFPISSLSAVGVAVHIASQMPCLLSWARRGHLRTCVDRVSAQRGFDVLF